MDCQQAIIEIDKICEIARFRMNLAEHQTGVVYSEIMWMTQEETQRFFDLKKLLPSSGQQRHDAIERLKKRRNIK